jgi:glycosyltransferase involved in cell wall biosynthesis
LTSSTTIETSAPLVWVLTNAPSPYQVELLSAVAERSDLHLHVRFLRDIQAPGPQRRFSYQICRTWLAFTKGDELRVHGHPIQEAAFGQYDLFILSGLYTSMTFLVCATILHCRGRKWALWWERPRSSLAAQQRSWPSSWLHNIKDKVRRWLLLSADLVIGIGSAAVREYEALGVPPSQLRMLPYCCDVASFAAVSTASRDRVRRALGWPDRLVFLFSGQLIPRKGVDVLLRAFIQLAETHTDVALLLLGIGIYTNPEIP